MPVVTWATTASASSQWNSRVGRSHTRTTLEPVGVGALSSLMRSFSRASALTV